MSWKLRAAVTALLLAPQAGFALGLGDVRLKSALNEPLSAEIELVAPTAEELTSLTAELASREMFQRYGLDRPRYLDSLQFRVGRGADGRNVLLVNSGAPISEPFVTFLVEVNWPRGRLLREYTVLLDPPVYAPAEAAPPAPVAAPRVSRPAAPAPAPAPTRPAQRPAAAAPSGEMPSTYRVQRGDTLYGIASRYAEGGPSAVNRTMIAMFRANPEAFSGNVNLLRAGAILRVPGPDAVEAVGAAEAASEIGRQTAAWRSSAATPEEGRLRLVTPTEAAPELPATEARATDVPSRIEQLNREIAESQRLLDLKSAELAQLQQQLSEREAAAEAAAQAAAAEAAEAEAAAKAEAAAAAAAEAAVEAPVEAPVEAQVPAAEEAPAPAEPAAREPTPAPAPAAPPAPSFFDKLTDNLAYVLGAAVLLLGGGLAFGYARRRREEDLDEALRSFEPPAGAPVPSETLRLRALAVPGGMETAATDESDEASLRADRVAEKEPEFGAPRREPSLDETMSAEAPIDLDQGDALAEADFHMAYGLYDQAADIVKLALDKEPDRRDYKLKLAEIFFVAGNKSNFLDAARELQATRGEGDAAEWDRVVIMGRQIAPHDPLFEGAVASGGVDLNLEGGDSRVDLELLAPPEGEEGIDLDLSEALSASDSVADTGESELLDFDVESAGMTGSTTAEMPEVHADLPTAEMPALGTEPPTEKMQKLGEITAEMPTVELPAGDSPTVEATRLQPPADDTLREKVDSSGFSAEAGGGDTTAEMPMDDLGIDLGELEAFAEGPPEDDVTRITPADEETRRMLADAEVDEQDVGTALLPALQEDGGEVDFDLSDRSPATARGESHGIDLDVGGSFQDDGGDGAETAKMSFADLPEMSELEPVTMSEVGTKLDLARAYVDMGDPDGARSILQEVLKEGSSSQKRDAQGLLDSLPGE